MGKGGRGTHCDDCWTMRSNAHALKGPFVKEVAIVCWECVEMYKFLHKKEW